MTREAGTTREPDTASAAAATRIMARCDELAEISAMPEGILRAYLTEEHRRHNALAARWMAKAGLRVWQDAAGNQCGRLEGARPGLPALIIGSHLDTVPDAGRYDGILGVLLGIEAARRLAPQSNELPFALEIIAYADEEGTRFGATLLGSRAMAGTWDPAWWETADAEGVTMAQAFRDFGLDPEKIGDAARAPEDLAGYLEAHIEQGPYLEAAGRPLGLVSSIAGARRFTLNILGEARHAGGTPYERRRDALIGAAQAVLDVERIGRARGVIATVGQLRVHPGAVNVVPGEVEFSLDLRAESDTLRDSAWEEIHAALSSFCGQRGLELVIEEIHSAPTVSCSPRLRQALAGGVAETGDQDPITLYSRAGHDAMAMAAVTEIGMLFTRCEDGISHHPEENVLEADVALALQALECAVWTLAAQHRE